MIITTDSLRITGWAEFNQAREVGSEALNIFRQAVVSAWSTCPFEATRSHFLANAQTVDTGSTQPPQRDIHPAGCLSTGFSTFAVGYWPGVVAWPVDNPFTESLA
ncbi:MAG: hypothetical protein ACOX61_01855 [Brooklawnia sp.]